MEKIRPLLVKDAPLKIHLQVDPDENTFPYGHERDVTWCKDVIHSNDVTYLRADLFEEMIEALSAVYFDLLECEDWGDTLKVSTIEKVMTSLDNSGVKCKKPTI